MKDSSPCVLRARTIVFACLGAAFVAVLASVVPATSPVVWALRVFAAAVVVVVVPGVLTVTAWRPRQSFSALMLVAVGLSTGFAIVQLLTIAAVMYAWSVGVSLALLAAWSLIHGAAAMRRGGGIAVTVSRSEAGLAVVLALLGVVLYVAGSPFDTTEPRIHISIVRRLLAVANPTLYTMYLAPDVVYTYPFPGTHYLLAMMARAEGIDPFFLYYKTRAIWGVAAPLLLYACARVIFENARIALATTLVAVGFVANGVFGGVPDFSWAQLAPYSHASDIAMGVFLPALLLAACEFLAARDIRSSAFFLVLTLAMGLMLIMVHPREIVQFLVYCTGFAAVAALPRPYRPMALRAGLVVAGTLLILVVYQAWQAGVATDATALVEREQSSIAQMLRGASWSDLLGVPVPLLTNYMVAYAVIFSGWSPLVLLASPFVLLAFRTRPLMLLIGASIVCYLLIIRLPVLGLPYLYLTYFEMLYTPIRNVIFFVHLLAGVVFYLAAAWLARYSSFVMIAASLVIALIAAAIFHRAGPYLAERTESSDLLFGPVFAAYAVVGWLWWRWREMPTANEWIDAPRPRWVIGLAAICVPLLIATELPSSSLRNLSLSSSPATPEALFQSLPCPRDAHGCPPPDRLITFSRNRIPADGVFAVDLEQEYQPTLFMPQQMVAWPGRAEGLIPRAVFVRYYEHYDRAMAAHGGQPLFNDVETRADRLAFIADLHVTHVLVNPRVYGVMSRVLADDPDVFSLRYDDGRWAIWEVTPRFRSLRL